MKTKEIIAGGLLVLGILLAVGAVGTLDFLGNSATEDDLIREVVKSIIAVVLMAGSAIVTRKVGKNDE